MFYGNNWAVSVQTNDVHVYILEKEVDNFRNTHTAVRQHQRSRDVKNDPRRVPTKYLQVGTSKEKERGKLFGKKHSRLDDT